jgi:hypothetical protein
MPSAENSQVSRRTSAFAVVWFGHSLSVHEHRKSLFEAGHQIVSSSVNFEVTNAVRELICYVTVKC